MSDTVTRALRAIDADIAARTWPKPLDVRTMLTTEPERPAMIIEDWLPCGYATLLAGHGGAGKSSIALGLAVAIATGGEWAGMQCAMRRVLYLSCEDRESVIHWRLSRLAAHEGIGADDLRMLDVRDLVEHETILLARHPQAGLVTTAAYTELERVIRETGASVLFVDGVADTFGGSENDRAEVKQFIRALVRLVGTDGAVVLIAHVNKPTATAGTSAEGYSGSTGWHNSVRARWYLYPETERGDEGATPTGDLILALQKTNLGRPAASIRWRWDEAAHMFVADGAPSRFDTQLRDDDERDGIVAAMRAVIARGDYIPAAMQGPRTAHHVLEAEPEMPDALKTRAGRRRFWRHIEQLRRIGVVRESSIRRASRHPVAILVPRAAPDMAAPNAPIPQ